MTRDLIIGIDAGTSVLKCVAFTPDGVQVGVASRPNSYTRFGRGCVEQDMLRTWHDAKQTLCESKFRMYPRRRVLITMNHGSIRKEQ